MLILNGPEISEKNRRQVVHKSVSVNFVHSGALSPDGLHWIPCKGNYLFNERASSLVFRGKFMELMKKACLREDLKLGKDQHNHLKAKLYAMPWIIDVRNPVINPERLL